MKDGNVKLVMCAEDDADDFELFCETATSVDPSVELIHANNGLILLEKLNKLTIYGRLPGLFALEMNMPVMDCRETLLRIKANEEWKSIPIGIYTTSAETLYDDLKASYVVLVLRKPSQYSEIVNVVKQMLAHCSSSDA